MQRKNSKYTQLGCNVVAVVEFGRGHYHGAGLVTCRRRLLSGALVIQPRRYQKGCHHLTKQGIHSQKNGGNNIINVELLRSLRI